ncbi:MAG: bacteriohemerythrin [Deltaproteobacteria bacterium]|jgi:hemerythrin|nr:bacteriohemerythrin [Deltaproteobacteria bacterium]
MLFTKSLETGVPKIDEQHKELFAQADKLRDIAHKERIPETLEFLKSYVAKHFSMEEALMKASQYPKHAFHHQLHVEFVETFKKLYTEYKANGEKFATVLSINTVVNNWLREHIMKHDKEFADYYIQKTANRRRDGEGASAGFRQPAFGQKPADPAARQPAFGQKPAAPAARQPVFGQKPAALAARQSVFGQKPAAATPSQSIFGQKAAPVAQRFSTFSGGKALSPEKGAQRATPVVSKPAVKPSGGGFSSFKRS